MTPPPRLPSTSAGVYDDSSTTLSRTCRLDDFGGCRSAADWQQRLAHVAWSRCRLSRRPDASTLVLNRSGCPFTAPGVAIAVEWRLPETTGWAGVFALSVLDRIEEPMRFLRICADRLTSSGIVLCTFAAWNASGPDLAVGHELRKRIYSFEPRVMRRIIDALRADGLALLGPIDWTYHGDVLGDHTLASLVFTKGART